MAEENEGTVKPDCRLGATVAKGDFRKPGVRDLTIAGEIQWAGE